ncbi:hypothetical protein ASO20_01080 [Mycoplasma sp. (ex Biomphalaria glabrata)]|uniref:oxidoreductase n=1 Tax=Mycoplasma sp. (ex Biomphalaria glabrata) TaxID=1749074 RepID=UPI00073AA9DD|nr:hypothetical protein [Mycoplasma sp. (ex Biomphalaria glabrata)]ALV23251.1 hypothetical protein ASO20_01080 [Mycoplasma sp. (ex Biomphalaria glabrata)]
MKKISDSLELLSNVIARNRIILPPMDTAMSIDGYANDYHIMHYGARSYGGYGTIIVEATAVSPNAKITEKDLGLWDDRHIDGLKKIVEIVKKGGSKIGIQLAHAGSKAEVPNAFGVTKKANEWFGTNARFCNDNDLIEVVQNFISAAKRAKKAGFDFIEIHGAHGYLICSMLNPYTNDLIKTKDICERGKYLIEIVKGISKILPTGIRLSPSDNDNATFKTLDFAPIVKELDKYLDYYHISGGDIIDLKSNKIIKEEMTYDQQLPFFSQMKTFRTLTKKNVIAVNRYKTREDVLKALDNGADAVAIGRCALFNPAIIMTDILTKEEFTNDYHWNNNPWWNPVSHAKRNK